MDIKVKRIINWFRDLIYNFTDYAIILCVIAAVAAILIWRFNALFDLKIDKDTIKPDTPPIDISADQDNIPNNDDNSDGSDETNNPDNSEDPDNNDSNTPDDDQNNQPDQNNDSDVAVGTEISFNVPAGSFPSKIADILLTNNLIEDKQAFLTRCVELKLDTKLKSGDFTIKKGTSLDEIIKLLAK